MAQLVTGPTTSSVLVLAGDVATILQRIEFQRVFGDTITLGRDVLFFINTTQPVTMRVAFSQDGGITYYDRGTVDLLNPGITYNGSMTAIGEYIRVQFTATVNATTVTSRFTVRT